MCYGACTWIFGNTKVEEIASELSNIGYDGIELLGDWKRYPLKETKAC